MAFDHAFDIAHHLFRQSQIGRQNQNAQIRITIQKPRAKQPDQRGLARIAKRHQQKLPLPRFPAILKPRRHIAMMPRQPQPHHRIPDPDKLAKPGTSRPPPINHLRHLHAPSFRRFIRRFCSIHCSVRKQKNGPKPVNPSKMPVHIHPSWDGYAVTLHHRHVWRSSALETPHHQTTSPRLIARLQSKPPATHLL